MCIQPNWVPVAQGLCEVTAKLFARAVVSNGGLTDSVWWRDCSQTSLHGCWQALVTHHISVSTGFLSVFIAAANALRDRERGSTQDGVTVFMDRID